MPARSKAINRAWPRSAAAPERRVRPDEQRPQVLVAALGYFAEDRAVSRRLLLRHETEPGAEVASLLEAGAISDRCHHGTRGPMPGTVIRCWQLSSCSASPSISVDTLSIRGSSRRQSCARSAMRFTILGESTSVFALRISGSALRRGTTPCAP
jgi:hypothetical protein